MQQTLINIGDAFGKLVVISRPFSDKGHTAVMCACECGNCIKALAFRLTNGVTKSCNKGKCKPMAKHGLSKNPEYTLTYNSWKSMIARCAHKQSSQYINYGAKGIQVCDRWLSFENFLLDMGKRPSKNHSIDRVNNGLGYDPSNCRWATSLEQTQNRNNSVRLTAFGKTLSVFEWAKETGIRPSCIYQRLAKGLDHEQILIRPSQYRKRLGSANAVRSMEEFLKL